MTGGAATVVERARWDAPPPLARPSDRCERWPVDRETVAPLAKAAAGLGIAFELAAVVTVERSLLGEDLDFLGLGDRLSVLDVAANAAVVTTELSEPLAAYLCALDRSTNARSRPTFDALVLPMRISERIGSATPGLRLDVALLPSAIAWERAAVVAGRTMSEWALLSLAGRSD